LRDISGTSPMLRAFAWLSVGCLLGEWMALGAGHRPTMFFLCSHIFAFIAGISSLSPLGGMSSVIAVISLRAIIPSDFMGAAC